MREETVVIRRAVLFASVALLVSPGTPAFAQIPRGSADCGHANGATVRGVIKTADAGNPIVGWTASLSPGGCNVLANRNGSFELRNIAPGRYILTTPNTTERQYDPVALTVRGNESVQANLEIRTLQQIDRCIELRECANLIHGRSSKSASLTSDQQLRDLAFRVTIALGRRSYSEEFLEWPACLEETDAMIIAAVQSMYPKALPGQACTHLGITRNTDVLLAETGERAMIVRILEIDVMSATARKVESSYVTGVRGGASYECHFELRGGRWEAARCTMTMQS